MVPYHTWARGYSKIHIELKFRKTNFFTKLISRNNFVQIFRFPKVTVCSSIQCVEIKEIYSLPFMIKIPCLAANVFS